MLAFVSTSAALLVPHFGRPAVPHPACRSAAVHMLDEADIPEAFKRKSKGPAPAPEILLVDREGDEVRFVMEGGNLRVYVANELFCGAIDTLTYSRDDGVVTVEDEVPTACASSSTMACPPHAHIHAAHGVHMACTWHACSACDASRIQHAVPPPPSPGGRGQLRHPCGGAGHEGLDPRRLRPAV